MVQKRGNQARQLLDEHKITSESLNQATNKLTNTEAKNQVNKQLPTYINQYRLLSTAKIASIQKRCSSFTDIGHNQRFRIDRSQNRP